MRGRTTLQERERERLVAPHPPLTFSSPPLTLSSLLSSSRTFQSVVRLGTGLIEKKVIQNSGPFRYAMLDTLSDSDATLFTQPLSLAKLARFITEARRETGSQRWTGKRAKPLILCALNALRGTYMVVGVTCNARYLDVRRSAIGTAFKEATKEIRDCRYRKDNFDSSVIEVHKDDVLPFIHALYDHVRP